MTTSPTAPHRGRAPSRTCGSDAVEQVRRIDADDHEHGLLLHAQRCAPTTHLCLLTDGTVPRCWTGPGRSAAPRRQDPSAVVAGVIRIALERGLA